MVQGISQIVRPEKPIFGLHLLQDAIGARRAITARQEIWRTALSMNCRKRDLICASSGQLCLSASSRPPARSIANQAGYYLRGHCRSSKLVPALWLVPGGPPPRKPDQIFWPTFYDLLLRRMQLGEAVWRARLAVRAALPHCPDWLTYTLFGDPRARPYWP